jgi:asparagine synthase (glutamine-hydrolysing)
MKGKKRGPEFSTLKKEKTGIDSFQLFLGFHRLAINGLDVASNQPLYYNDLSVICNGEIYNYKQILKDPSIQTKTNSDCEVILQLYEKNKYLCASMLDGVFSFILYDKINQKIMVARDPYGVRPLYETRYKNGNIGFASDITPLTFDTFENIRPFPPGSYAVYEIDRNYNCWKMTHHEKYFFQNSYLPYYELTPEPLLYYMSKFADMFKNAVRKRVDNCERDIACLLSGGLDSSLISAIVCKMYKEKTGKILQTYSIGLEGGEDLKYAKTVAEHIGSNHTEIIVTNDHFIESIPNVIRDIESYDTTTVRASVGNWNIGKYISENSEAKVIFNGDGADELAGGYLYFHKCPNDEEFDKETHRLLSDINRYDVLRSDKSISSHGLEPRTPFLDKELTRFYLSIPIEMRNHNRNKHCEKYFIRKSIELYAPELIPREILWRRKEAFSDGVSSNEKSWFEIIQEHVDSEKETTKVYNHNPPKTKEQTYYRKIFDSIFPEPCEKVIPYFWMPKYIEGAHDASARTLEIYNKSL